MQELEREVALFPPEKQTQFGVVKARCMKCHDLANRILEVGDEPDVLVHRMARIRDANIPAHEIPTIVEFLSYYEAHRPRAQKP